MKDLGIICKIRSFGFSIWEIFKAAKYEPNSLENAAHKWARELKLPNGLIMYTTVFPP